MVPRFDRLFVAGCAVWVISESACGSAAAWAGRCGHGCVFRTANVTWSEILTFVGVAGAKATWIGSWGASCTCVAVLALDWCCAAPSCALIATGFGGDDGGRVGSMPHCLRNPPLLS